MKQYHDLLRSILQNGSRHQDRTGVGTISHFGFQTRFNLKDGFPIVTTKKVPFRWVAEELFLFLSEILTKQTCVRACVDIWAEWADEEHCEVRQTSWDLGPVYGYRLRSVGVNAPDREGGDQIARRIQRLHTIPDSRRLIVTGWDPRQADNVDLPPCHTLFQFKVEGYKKLHCQLCQRSAAAFLGVPFNISSYALLTQLMAHAVIGTGEFVYSLGDYHIYLNHLEQVEELLSREPLLLPELEINDPDRRLRGLEGLLSVTYEHLNLIGYKSHGKIAAPVAV